jgi:hypothetical protein
MLTAGPRGRGAAGPVFNMVSQQEKVFCVLRFEVSRSVITVQRECRARIRTAYNCLVPNRGHVRPVMQFKVSERRLRTCSAFLWQLELR